MEILTEPKIRKNCLRSLIWVCQRKRNLTTAAELLGQSFTNIKAGSFQGYLNLVVAPLLAKKEKGLEYLTMTEALEGDLLEVTEISEGGSVPNLRVSNKSVTDNILLLDGEELQGAKQNRALNTTILAGASTEIVVPVSCTERAARAIRKAFTTWAHMVGMDRTST